MNRYFLKQPGQTDWQEVSLKEFCLAERAAGFHPNLPKTDPLYMLMQVTNGFDGEDGVSGRVELITNAQPEKSVSAVMRQARDLADRQLDSHMVLTVPAPAPIQSLPLQWTYITEALPPDPEGNWFSPEVWLALSDGRVVRGKCLHRHPEATYDAPVHSWFAENSQLPEGVTVLAWMPFAVPEHPQKKLARHAAI